MGELHSTDKSVIKEAFTFIRQLANPTTYALAFQNAHAILRTADILRSIGIEEAVQLAELDVCVKKGIHEGRYQRWLDYSHDELEKLAKEDVDGKPEEQTESEKKGKYDISHSIQSFNKGRTIARTFCVLCKWLKKDMALLQGAKDREERTGGKPAANLRQTPMVNNYFGQQGQGNFNRFGGGRGGPPGDGGFRRQFGTNGAPQQGERPDGGNTRQHKPNRHPDSEEALAK